LTITPVTTIAVRTADPDTTCFCISRRVMFSFEHFVHAIRRMVSFPSETSRFERGTRVSMSEVTRILSAIEQGNLQASEQLLPLVYDELRRLAAQRLASEAPGQTLQATALVHEAYLRLVDVEKVQHWTSRAHFFGAAAEAMRRILVNRARDKKRQKRGGGWKRVDLQSLAGPADG
jgi:hypothetical protein